MAKIKNLIRLSDHYKVDPEKLELLGILNPLLTMDTKLFIDPLLLESSKHSEIRKDSVITFTEFFKITIDLLASSKYEDDVAWRSAYRLLSFHEIKGTCLGYGSASISGSAFGPKLTYIITKTGKEIVDLGIRNPKLFPAMALLESDIGPDRISDMTTNIILNDLITFNKRILDELNLKGQDFTILGKSGLFLRNPYQKGNVPIILVPTDVLRSLPIVNDRSSLLEAAEYNESLKDEINKNIGNIWKAASKEIKEKLRAEALSSKASFNTILTLLHLSPKKPYDVEKDPEGIIKWLETAFAISADNPLPLPSESDLINANDVFKIVGQIISQFKKLIEKNGLNQILFFNNKPRHERISQYLFFGIALTYCKISNLDISPEVDSGNGKVDFKFSKGFNSKVLVEIKLSKNSKVVSGYENQLNTYKASEESEYAYYIVIDVGNFGKREERLNKLSLKDNNRNTELVIIDATIKPTASKR